jgi:hypothetical protein
MAQQRNHASKSPAAAGPAKAARAAHEPSGAPQPLLSFQSAIGNQAFSRLLQSGRIRAKLAVGPSNDPLEKEADRVADAVDRPQAFLALTRKPDAVVRQKAQPAGGGPAAMPGAGSAAGLENNLRSASQGGKPLDPGVRAFMESRMGADFSEVKIHTGPLSAQLNRELNSVAFTHESHIHFADGKYDPLSPSGRRLLAHELAHVVQQGSSANGGLIQRNGDDDDDIVYQFKVPDTVKTLEEMYRLFNVYVFGVDKGITWQDMSTHGEIDLAAVRGKVVRLHVPRSQAAKSTDPTAKKEREESNKAYQGMKGAAKADITAEANKRYYERSGDKPGTQIKKGEEGKSQMWDQALADVLKDKSTLEKLPPAIKELMGPETSYKPMDYQHLLRIAEKLKKFTPEDLAAYKLLTIRATDNLDLFEKSVDLFLARREELKKALDQQPQPQQQGAGKEETLKDAIQQKWKGLDEAAIGTMSESDRYALARQKTSELTDAQLKYMREHPGETAKDFAKSALLLNTGETFGAIGKDLQEAANGDANSWARWAAGTGAGAKLSGWLLALAGVIYVASLFTGIGELATIATAAGVLLGTTLTLSYAESELRIKAASQAKTPEEFKRNVELAAAARANVIVGVALLVIALVLRALAKAAFPETMKKLSTSMKNFRERVRLKGSIYEIKPQIKAEMGALKGELAKQIEAAKLQAAKEAAEIEKLSTEQFAEKLDKGGAAEKLDKGGAGTIFDQSKLPPEQKLNYGELLKTPEGRSAIEGYRSKLVNALKTDAPAEFDRVAQEYNSKIDDFLKDVEAAKNHDDMNAAADKIEGTLTEEHAKKFIQGEQERITKQKLDEASAQAQQEAAKLAKDALLKRVRARIGGQDLPFTDAEIDTILKEGKELGLSDQAIEETLARAANSPKPVTAAEVVDRMKKRVEGERKAAEAKAEAERKKAAQDLKDAWDRFDGANDKEFRKKLRDFRGNDDLTMKKGDAGGEGQIFLSDKVPGRGLKRWFKNSPYKFEDSVKRLEQAQAVVDANPNLKKAMSVVRIYEKGSDWIVRDYDTGSVPIGEAIKDPNVAAIRQQAINALSGSKDPMAVEILKKLGNNSANIHWSAEQGKLLIIDTQ